MKKAHFFDIDILIKVDNLVWIVDKSQPFSPIMKISKYDFNLIKNGIYKSQSNSISLNGTSYWFPTDISNKLKINCKNHKVDISNLSFSMQEFMNADLIENLDFDINIETIQHIKNEVDGIFIICSKNSKRNYDIIVHKLEDKLKKIGLSINKYYTISDTFYHRDDDEYSYKKIEILIQHIVGYKIDSNSFTNNQIDKYDEVYFYDDDFSSLKLAKDVNDVFRSILSNTTAEIKDMVKSILKSKNNTLIINESTPNKKNLFISQRVELSFSNIIKAFEKFVYIKR